MAKHPIDNRTPFFIRFTVVKERSKDNAKENKLAQNDILPQRDVKNVDKDQNFQSQALNARKQENPIIDKRNGINDLHTTVDPNLKHYLGSMTDSKSGPVPPQQKSSNLKEGVKKKSFLCL